MNLKKINKLEKFTIDNDYKVKKISGVDILNELTYYFHVENNFFLIIIKIILQNRCAICLNILKIPIQCPICENLFCSDCIYKSFVFN